MELQMIGQAEEKRKVSSSTRRCKMAKRMSWSQADGKALRKERKSLDLSQADLGKLAGVTGSRVCEVETVVFPNGRRCTPALKLAEKLSKALGQVKARQDKKAERAKVKASK